MSRVYYKGEEEIAIIRESADILGRAHGEVAKNIKPGIKTRELDRIAEEFIRDNQGEPSFKGFHGFPSSLCISINEVVVHGFPSEYELKEGDILSIDCGVKFKGFHSDSAYTYPVGTLEESKLQFLRDVRESLYLGIAEATCGNRIGDIGHAIQSFAHSKGYTVVRELVGHGVGKGLHEGPEVPNYGKRGRGPVLKEGMVLAIEPMINLGVRNIVQENDGWTIRTKDRMPSAHFEHTIAIHKEKTEILTTHKYLEEVIKF